MKNILKTYSHASIDLFVGFSTGLSQQGTLVSFDKESGVFVLQSPDAFNTFSFYSDNIEYILVLGSERLKASSGNEKHSCFDICKNREQCCPLVEKIIPFANKSSFFRLSLDSASFPFSRLLSLPGNRGYIKIIDITGTYWIPCKNIIYFALITLPATNC